MSPAREGASVAAFFAALGLLAGIAIHGLVACVTRPPHPAVAPYAAALHACVDSSSSWPAYRACAADVERQYAAIRAEDRAR